MAVERTGNYKLPIPASDTAPWRRYWRELVTTLDATMSMLFTISDFVGAWDNSTAYVVGNVVLDTDSGVLYRCAASHNSAGGATTFQEDRVAHPTYWTSYASTVGFRGTWDTNVIYEKGDAIVNNDVLAIAAVGHTSSNSFDNDVAAGYWTILIDFGSVQQAAEDAQAAAEAAAATIPTPTVANNYIRIKSDLSGYERRTPSEARSDLGADNADNITSGTLAIAYGGTGQNTAINAFNALKQPATETATGVVELATNAETQAGIATNLAVTPAGAASAYTKIGRHAIPLNARSFKPASTNGCGQLTTIEAATSKAILEYLPFDAFSVEYAIMFFTAPVSSDEAEGILVENLHWMHPATTTDFGVVWQFEIVALGDDDAFDTAFGSPQTIADTGGTTNNIYTVSFANPITPGNTWEAGDLLICRLSRLTTDIDDTMAVDARFIDAQLVIITNKGED